MPRNIFIIPDSLLPQAPAQKLLYNHLRLSLNFSWLNVFIAQDAARNSGKAAQENIFESVSSKFRAGSCGHTVKDTASPPAAVDKFGQLPNLALVTPNYVATSPW